ncbi:hypothetical protein Glove_71g185 [Diversispora epigaea]|uniref:HAT C-terminal dimerisation domain-containing protein n=1 Tax=Diversispora epigaea TaxID=1348612 RepID=A0A397JKS3_9GLOM|nr:hypothetical protein Glove_71g185 [Diversispora epigaea]
MHNTFLNIEQESENLQELALEILAIVQNSASCERNFTLLRLLKNNKNIQSSAFFYTWEILKCFLH